MDFTSKRILDGLHAMELHKPDLSHSVLVKGVARALVDRWRDYAPTEAAFRGDACLRRGDTIEQHFWLYVVLASENLLHDYGHLGNHLGIKTERFH